MSLAGNGVAPISATSTNIITPAIGHLQPNHFDDLWSAAKTLYKTDTGHDLGRLAFAAELDACDSADSVARILENHTETFEAYRAHGKKLRAVLDPVVRVLQFFLETGGEVATSVSHLPYLISSCSLGINPNVQTVWCSRWKGNFRCVGSLTQGVPATPLLSRLRLLIYLHFQATNGVSHMYDALERLLTRLGASLSRLGVYVSSPSTPINMMQDIYVRTLVQLLKVLGRFTKYFKHKPSLLTRSSEGATFSSCMIRSQVLAMEYIEDYMDVIFRKPDVEDALKQLEELTAEELAFMTTKTLDGVRNSTYPSPFFEETVSP